MDFMDSSNADFICLQETKATREIVEELGWRSDLKVFANEAEKKGYSGTAIVTPHEPLSVVFGLGIDEHDGEGRVVTLENNGSAAPGTWKQWVYFPNTHQVRNQYTSIPKLGYPLCLTASGGKV